MLGFNALARAEDEKTEVRWNVKGECQMVTLPQKAALLLIPDLSDETKIEAAWISLQQMIVRGEATLVANIVLVAKSGERVVSESIEEFRYPTEYDPPQLPDPKESNAEVVKNWPVSGITPTAFETRNVGAVLELTGNVTKDGEWIDVATQPQHVRLLRMAKYDAGVRPSGERLFVEQPQFLTLTNTLEVRVRHGQRLLVGVHKLPDEEARMELFLLRVGAQKTGDGR
jgi:hypothetical protein